MRVVKLATGALPQSWRRKFREARSAVRLGFRQGKLGFVSRNPVAASLYYTFVTGGLSREAQAVAAGQRRYIADRLGDDGNYYLLRRNIHRLEKGLVMRPRRKVFARDFINETVRNYSAAVGSACGSNFAELVWARDVLAGYFAVVDHADPKIAQAHAVYAAAGTPNPESEEAGAPKVPYARNGSPPLSVDYDDFLQLCRRRRSVRWYRNEALPRDLVDRALTAAAQAPSACNRQPFAYRIFDEPKEAQEITALAGGTKGFSDQVPAVAVLVGQLRAYPFERDRHAIYIDASLSAMSFMLALETLGAASCPINWPDQEPDESRMRARLKLEPDERVIMLISFGWPDPEGMVPYSAKRELERMRSYA